MTGGRTVSRNFRLNPATLEKVQDLRERYGSYSAVLTVAIDRLYRAERPKENEAAITMAAMTPEEQAEFVRRSEGSGGLLLGT